MNFLIEYEPYIRTGIFVGLLLVLSFLEFISPLTRRKDNRPHQWFTNLSIVIIDTLTLRLLFPILAVGTAYYASDNNLGFFNVIEINSFISILLSLLMLDLLIYGQHVMMHKIPMLWRLHRMHHTELGLDTTSAVRFHPFEIILSMLIKMLFVLIMGIPVVAVIIFEIILNGLALFNHSNIKLPGFLETFLRRIIITPEIHWIHHSEITTETNSNYGFNLSVWDKLFSTYIDKPTFSYDEMQQGLKEFGTKKPLNLIELLISPFKDYAEKNIRSKTE